MGESDPSPAPSAAPPAPAPRARRGLKIGLAITLLVLVAGSLAAKRQWRYIKTDPAFCVTCHLMEKPGEKWRSSAHKDVACQTCHRANIFEEANFGFQAYIVGAKDIGKHAPLDVAICAECHLSSDPRWKQVAATAGHRAHFAQRDISCLSCHVTRLHEFQPDTAACTKCHGASKLKIADMRELHCLGCHDFMNEKGGDHASLIPDGARCRTCHPAIASEEHPAMAIRPLSETATATAVVDGSRITQYGADKPERLAVASLPAKAAPTAKGHEDCLGCHDPHGKKLEDPVGCLKCHVKLLDAGSKHYKDERLQSCRDCHHPHKLE